jgi:glycosyltransferase involved in cell wall biosynthesis
VAALFAADGPLAAYELEHIFADNASSDATPAILTRLASEDHRTKVIFNARNFGFFRSNFNALRYATGDAVLVFLPADLQDPPDLLPEMVKLWENGYDVVAGERDNRQETWALRTSRRMFYRIVNRISDFRIPENVGEFQLIDRKVWRAVVAHEDQYPYIRGIIASVGFRRIILPYNWQTRKRGISKNNLFQLIDQALNGIFSFTSVPMRIASFAGFFVAALAMIYALVSAILGLLDPDLAPRGTMTVIVALFFFSGVQLIFIGILGEYVTAIHAQVRRGPIVVERDRLNFPELPLDAAPPMNPKPSRQTTQPGLRRDEPL